MEGYDRHKESPVREGDIVTLKCISIGKKGDGVFKTEDGFVIIVPGTQENCTYKIRITIVKTTVAFGEIVSE